MISCVVGLLLASGIQGLSGAPSDVPLRPVAEEREASSGSSPAPAPALDPTPLVLRIPAELGAAGVVAAITLGGGFALMNVCGGVPCFGAVVLASLAAHTLGSAAVINLVGDLLGGQGRFEAVLMGTGSAIATSLMVAGFVGASIAYSGGSDQLLWLSMGALIGGGPAILGTMLYEIDSDSRSAIPQARSLWIPGPSLVFSF